jgi:hypothetical protein
MVRLQLIYSLKELVHFCYEHLVDFSTYLLHSSLAALFVGGASSGRGISRCSMLLLHVLKSVLTLILAAWPGNKLPNI